MSYRSWCLHGLCCVKHCLLSVYIVLLLTLSHLSAGRIWCRQNNLVSLLLAICCTVQSGSVGCICSCRGMQVTRGLTAAFFTCRMDVLSGDLLLWILATFWPYYAFASLACACAAEVKPVDSALLHLEPVAAAPARYQCPGQACGSEAVWPDVTQAGRLGARSLAMCASMGTQRSRTRLLASPAMWSRCTDPHTVYYCACLLGITYIAAAAAAWTSAHTGQVAPPQLLMWALPAIGCNCGAATAIM